MFSMILFEKILVNCKLTFSDSAKKTGFYERFHLNYFFILKSKLSSLDKKYSRSSLDYVLTMGHDEKGCLWATLDQRLPSTSTS